MKLKAAVVGLAALGGLALTVGSASALPNGLPEAARDASPVANAEQVRWACDAWGRCGWRRPVWGPRRVWGPGVAWGSPGWGSPGWGSPGWGSPGFGVAWGSPGWGGGWGSPAWRGAYAWGPAPGWGAR